MIRVSHNSHQELDKYSTLSEKGLNIFFAGGSFRYDEMFQWGVDKQLISFYHDTNQNQLRSYEGKENHFIILDSGAFSAWQQNVQIDINKYIDIIVEFGDTIGMAANLDVIPGKQGMKASEITSEMKRHSAERGWENYLYIIQKIRWLGREDLCKKIMPIHHQGESLDVLKMMVDFGCDYIGISPSNDYTSNQRMNYLDEVYDYLGSLHAYIRTHGYGVTSEKLMSIYPWFSVDSISWIFKAGLGQISTPFGSFIFSDDPRSLRYKDNVRIIQDLENGIWFVSNSLIQSYQKKIEEYLSDHLMVTVNALSTEYHSRAQANVIYLKEYERSYQRVERFYSRKAHNDITSIFE